MTSNVSVVIPTHNGGKFLPKTIESILEQTYPPFEIIVVDDGSTDETKQVCDRYPSVQYLFQTKQGVAVARNVGIRASKAENLIFLDRGDCLMPEAIEIGVDCINAYPEVGFVFGRYLFYSIQTDGTYQVEERYKDQAEVASYKTLLALQHNIQCSCVVFRRVALRAA